MFNLDNWTEIWATIKGNKLRSILTAFGVFWGIFILVIMLGSSKGFETGLRQTFEGVATNSAFVWTQTSSIPYKGYNAGRFWQLKNQDIEGIKRLNKEVEMIAPRIQIGREADNVVYEEMKGSYSIYGDYPEYFKIFPTKLLEGRLINERDIAKERKVAIIGERIKEELYRRTNPVGKYIQVNGVYFMVIGVVKSTNSNMVFGSRPEETVYIPFKTLQKTYGLGDVVHFFAYTVKEDIAIEKVEDKVKNYLLKQHDLSPDDMQAVGGFNIQREFDRINGLFKGLNMLSWFVGFVTLLAGIIGVSNIMLIAIRERTKEIGIKRALGAQSKLIRRQILFESVILTAFSGFFGLFVSVALLELTGIVTESITRDTFIKFIPSIDFQFALLALTILIIGGILAGMIPANKAISIKPIDALRDE